MCLFFEMLTVLFIKYFSLYTQISYTSGFFLLSFNLIIFSLNSLYRFLLLEIVTQFCSAFVFLLFKNH